MPPNDDRSRSSDRPRSASTKDAARQRVIKRYASRKLYDTATKAYITMDEVARLIREGEDVAVMDTAGNDVTGPILVQIIAEHEQSGDSPLPTAVLADLVRLYGAGASALTPDFLTQAVTQGQAAMRRLSDADPTGTLKAVETWQTAQARMLGEAFGLGGMTGGGRRSGGAQRGAAAGAKGADAKSTGSLEERVAALEEEVAELRAAIEGMSRT